MVTKKSGKWYGRVPGSPKPVPLSANKVVAGQILAENVMKADLGKAGILDPYEDHRTRPLTDHLNDYRRELDARGNVPRYVETVCARLTAPLTGCKFTTTADLSAQRDDGLAGQPPSAQQSGGRGADADLAAVQASAKTSRRTAMENATTAQDGTVTAAAATYRVAVDTADAASYAASESARQGDAAVATAGPATRSGGRQPGWRSPLRCNRRTPPWTDCCWRPR